jgi:hypothetical protein
VLRALYAGRLIVAAVLYLASVAVLTGGRSGGTMLL